MIVPLDLKEHFPNIESGEVEVKQEVEGSLISILNEAKNLCRFYEIAIPKYLKGAKVALLWNLWELVITETPLLVVADSAEEASFTVGVLASLAFPLRFLGNCHPYTTLNDPAIKAYSEVYGGKKWPFVLLGTCNPYLSKVLREVTNSFSPTFPQL